VLKPKRGAVPHYLAVKLKPAQNKRHKQLSVKLEKKVDAQKSKS